MEVNQLLLTPILTEENRKFILVKNNPDSIFDVWRYYLLSGSLALESPLIGMHGKKLYIHVNV